MKVRKEKTGEEEKKHPAAQMPGKVNQAGVIAVCLGIAAVVFFILLSIEKNMMESYEKQEAVIVRKTVPSGTVLDAGNISEYLELAELETAAIPEGALRSMEEAQEHMPAVTLQQGTILSASLLTDKKEQLAKLSQPVVAGFRAEDIGQIVCGTLRSGDIIHIYVTDQETEETTQVWEEVFVEEVFDGTGTRIEPGDTTSSAQVINVLLSKADIEYFYSELAKGTIRVVKEY